MPWTVDDSAQRRVYNRGNNYRVEAAAMSKYHQWKRMIVNHRLAPNVAASRVGDMHYEALRGRNNGTFTIRLSQQHRVAFTVDQRTQSVHVFQIGGHYPDQTN